MELDLHGKNLFQARTAVMSALARATAADYRLRIIHGHKQGSAIRDMVAVSLKTTRASSGWRAAPTPDRPFSYSESTLDPHKGAV